MSHTKPYIRKKAVLIMYKLFLKYPESLRPAFPRLKEKLEDPDPAGGGRASPRWGSHEGDVEGLSMVGSSGVGGGVRPSVAAGGGPAVSLSRVRDEGARGVPLAPS
ncbi:hypothetical protein P7K49_032843 [Saguinus oedipus]|uniref:Clathrin/coatomer adaptor adaptin-like N-terminal domain-containing protein n=1 Tax=Saguinus oedipus TaxID=9490 RepID=A0ABQ9TQ90_SAGOE|nr:hypothetical protein P7K49_032843 [Saguinus oedipus]